MFDFTLMNDHQKKAVTATDGPVLIIAGPGTGKTFTLVKRIAYIVLEKHVAPGEIMAVTFTEKAARELLTRISDEFGDREYILYQIENELNTQFNTRKQLVLKTIYAYVDHSGSLYDTDCLSMFGTNSFNLVWESVCSDIMNNQLDCQLGSLHLPIPLKSGYVKTKRLIDLIEKPFWSATGKTANDTLIPDLVTIEGDQFIIFDAKYYNAQLDKGTAPKGQPGIESVTKQYLYQLAFQKFICEQGFTEVKNCFLMPTEEDEVIDKKSVSMNMLSALGLQDIEVRFLPAKEAYDHYLTGKHLDVKLLRL